MSARRALLPVLLCMLLGASASAAFGATRFRPRIGGAMGLVPPLGSRDVATGALTPVVYHAGSVMSGGVTVHTIFWAPPGFQFDGSPGFGIGNAIPGYEALLQQSFTDVAHDSGATSNVFSVLPQFAHGTKATGVTPGAYSISYRSSTDSVHDTNPYPAAADQCASPANVTTCITDAQVQAEVDRVVQATPGAPHGLHDLWFVFLPPNVDECITPGACGTNAFGGYHSLSNLNGHGVTIYAVVIDPLIEMTIPPGSDPEGNPDAEAAIDVAAHETVEAMTDPEGAGWLDPNGFEVGDKCEFGPQHGTPLGFAGTSNSPYNQVINGDKYLTQEMWSNDDNGCIQRTTLTGNPLPLPQVNLTQFASTVTGNIGSSTAGVAVKLTLQRAAADGSTVTVAAPSTTTTRDGSWSLSLAPHAVGDDRDQIIVGYSGAGAPVPGHQAILSGNGGNPFTESGSTGWFDLDNGSFVTNKPSLGGPSVTLGPCFQTGVLGLSVNGRLGSSPTDFCNTQTDTATVSTSAIGAGVTLSASSNDNRAFSAPDGPTPNRNGALVSLSVPVGEADAPSFYTSPLATFAPSGFPSCTADMEAQQVACTGLVPGVKYTLTDGHAGTQVSRSADNTGAVSEQFARGSLKGGDAVSLSNGARTLTKLHVAHLRVSIIADQTVLSGGTCEAGAYYGRPLSDAPTNPSTGGPGVALTGKICPLSGRASGLSTSTVSQADELSAGQTQTEVPYIEDTSPLEGETLYGRFTALAESGPKLPSPNNPSLSIDRTSTIALRIARAAGGQVVFHARNVATPTGVSVKALKPGSYRATWTLRDVNGDTRTLTTRFVEQAGLRGPRGPADRKPKVTCKEGRHNVIRCSVKFPKQNETQGTLRMTIVGGGRLAALGHGEVKHRTATITLHEVRRLEHGVWTVTLVLTRRHRPARMVTLRLRA